MIKIRPITAREFELFQVLIHQEAGLLISPARKHQLERKLARRLQQLNLKTYEQYFERVAGNVEQELVTMLDSLAAKETRFFREPEQFRFLERHVFPHLEGAARAGERPRRVRAWSAGCSTGEEAYSLAMTLLDHFSSSEWRVEVIASDLSSRMVEAASLGVWPARAIEEIPHRFLKYLHVDGDTVGACDELRSAIRFERLNLNRTSYPIEGGFDLIFCRNVLIYFDGECRRRIISRLLHHLAADGYLVLGHAESLAGVGRGMQEVDPGIFTFNAMPALVPISSQQSAVSIQ